MATNRAPFRTGTRALPWILLFGASQAAVLRLTSFTHFATYPHLVDWAGIVASRKVELVVLAVQAVAVVLGLGPARIVSAARAVLANAGLFRSLTILAVLGFGLAIPTESAYRFAGEVLLAAWIAIAALLNLVLVANAFPSQRLDAATAWSRERVTLEAASTDLQRWDRALPGVLALSTMVVCAVLSWFVLDGVPHIDDSIAYLFQAKTFALGNLTAGPPPDANAFAATHLVVTETAWYSKYFPGWPAILAFGVALKAPWLVNPLVGAATILLAHALTLRLYDRGTANATVLLLAASPWFLFSSSEMMSHPSALAVALLALLAIERQRSSGGVGWAIVAGAAMGLLFLIRPLDAVLLGAVAAAWGFGLWGSRLSFAALGTIAVVALGVASLSFAYNAAITGDPLLAPHRQWTDALFGPGVDVLGFGKNVGIPLWRDQDPLPGHGVADVMLNANKNVYMVSTMLFGWTAGSFALALLQVVCGTRKRADGLLVALTVAPALAHTMYWHPGGPDLGARYWYLMLFPLVVLTVRGASALGERLRLATSGRWSSSHVTMAIVLASAMALGLGVPWQSATRYHRYREVSDDVRVLAAGHHWDHALVFVRSTRRNDYQTAFNFNVPTLSGPGPVYAMDDGPVSRAVVVRRFADREIWIIGRPPDGSARLVVLEGPLPAGQVPSGASLPYERPLQARIP